jgi:hypothetical protein
MTRISGLATRIETDLDCVSYEVSYESSFKLQYQAENNRTPILRFGENANLERTKKTDAQKFWKY